MDLTQTSQTILSLLGLIFLVLVIVLYIIAIFIDSIDARKNKYWIWDTISNYCLYGRNYYLLIIICSYGAIYLSIMYSLEFQSHGNESPSLVWYLCDLFSNICLIGIGIFPTNYHSELFKKPISVQVIPWKPNFKQKIKQILYLLKPKNSFQVKAILHCSCGLMYFLETCISNVLWTAMCWSISESEIKEWHSILILRFTQTLSILDCILFICFVLLMTLSMYLLNIKRQPILDFLYKTFSNIIDSSYLKIIFCFAKKQ